MSELARDRTAAPATDGRFEIEELLGQGGMGAVYRARAPVRGRQVALKRLSSKVKASHVALFEREYHTLASLRHPNIVEVFDYGTDAEGPWYTMELLEGGDLCQAAPLAWPEVCRILRDVASALALIHARRLLHRDISARNVWRTPDGKIKLIDFGALSAFGRPGELTGTPPFVAPEALHCDLLDQRTDLYATGALGYFLLTGLHAFPARELADLDELWRQAPVPPSARVRELCRSDLSAVPTELDALIDALLSRDAMARPPSAAELIDRLDAIAPAPDTAAATAVEGSLGKTAFVGRAAIMSALQRALGFAAAGRGSAAVVEGDPGLGRSRVLGELGLSVRLSGAVALQVDPAQHRGELYGSAQAFALQLLDTLPDLSRTLARPHAAVLGHLSGAVRDRLGLTTEALAPMPDAPGEARMRTHAALADWFLAVAKERTLALLADDLDAFDEASAAWLASLARVAHQTKLLVIGALPRAAVDRLSQPVRSLRQVAAPFVLQPLTADETLGVLRSIFGDAPRLARLAETLQRASGGTPAHLLELVEHLFHARAIEYANGAWILPQDLDQAALPHTHAEALSGRLARLTPETRALAQMLSQIHGRISLEAVKALANGHAARAFSALESLVKEGVLDSAEGGYRFMHDALRRVLHEELSESARATAHRTLGALLVEAGALSVSEKLRAGLHLMVGGDVERGRDLVCEGARELATTHVAELNLCVEQLEQALALFRRHGLPLPEQMPLLAALTSAGYYVDRGLATRYGAETLAAFAQAIGLPLAGRLRPFLGRKLSLLVALASVAIPLRLRGRRGGPLGFSDLILLLFKCAACLAGVYTICIDPQRAAACARVVEPLSALGKDHVAGVIYEFCLNLAATVTDRLGEADARWQRLVARLRAKKPIRGLPEELRTAFVAGGLYASGIMASWRDDPRALRIADELDGLKLMLYEMNADQIRVMYYGNQGDRERFDHYREQVEQHAIRRGSAWQAETWAAAAQVTVYLRMDDGMRMRQCVEQLSRIAADVPSLEAYQRRAQGLHLLIRGKPREALPLLEEILREEPTSFVAWARGCGALASAYNALGEHERARELCQRVLASLSTEDLAFPAMNLIVQVELAISEARLGKIQEAAEQLDGLLALHGPRRGPLTLGALHEARARVALLAGDEQVFEEHLATMEQIYQGTKVPTLIERSRRLAKRGSRAVLAGASGAHVQAEQLGVHLQTVLYRIRHGGSGTLRERARWALSQISHFLQMNEGYVYLANDEGAVRIAALAEGEVEAAAEPSAQERPANEELVRLDAWVCQRMIARSALQTVTAAVDDLSSLDGLNEIEFGGRTHRLVFLQTVEASDDITVGALVIPAEVVAHIPHTVLEAMASRLKTLTDTQTVEHTRA